MGRPESGYWRAPGHRVAAIEQFVMFRAQAAPKLRILFKSFEI
jgi:hypothetical protein